MDYYYYYYLVYIYGTFSLHRSIIDFFFFLVYICVTFFVTRLYIYIYIYIFFFFFFETYCHIVMVINSKLLIGHDIFEKYTKSKATKPHFIHQTAHVTAKLRCGIVKVLAKLHGKVLC